MLERLKTDGSLEKVIGVLCLVHVASIYVYIYIGMPYLKYESNEEGGKVDETSHPMSRKYPRVGDYFLRFGGHVARLCGELCFRSQDLAALTPK